MLRIENALHLGAPVDLLVDGAKIAAMTPAGHCSRPENCEVFNANGLMLLPSFTDAHTHMREPGQEYKEDIASGLSAALHGGFGAVMCMANTKPVNDGAAVTALMLEKAKKAWPDGPRLYPVAAASVALEGKDMAPLAELREAGCVAVSNDGRPLANAELVRRIMEYAADLGMIFIDHCEDPDLARGWIMHEGEMSGMLGLKGQPGTGEALQAARDVMLAEYLNLPVHIAHVSAVETLRVIEWGKSRGVKVTAETCPHYLLLTDAALADYNNQARVSPPLRGAADRDALRKAVKDGLIDILVTDHAPHAAHEKDDTLDKIPCGFTGLDLALSLTWGLVLDGTLAESDLHRLWSRRPGEIFSLPRNEFNPGDPADFFLFDPEEEWMVKPGNLRSKSCNTPFIGSNMHGRVKHHWIGGKKLL